jgi:hypothetical protein
MRHLLLTIAILGLTGCGPGPKSAKADEPKPLTESEFSKLQADLKPAASKETYTAALQRVGDSVAAVKGDTDVIISNTEQTNARLEAIESKLDALLAPATPVIQFQVPAPPAEPTLAPPVKADAPPTEQADRHTAGITFNGTAINVGEWLATPLTMKTRIGVGTRDTGNRAMVESHLRDHGLEGDFSKYSREQLITLHSVCHMKEPKPVKSTKPPKIAAAPAPIVQPFVQYQSGGCPNGQCGRPQYGMTQGRTRLFGRWR